MVKEIVIHLGDCKTGTTSIQSVLAAGGAAGACKSDLGDILYTARINHIPLAKSLTDPDEIPHRAARFSKLRQALDQSDATFGVISAEHFEFVDPDLVMAAIKQHLPEYTDRLRLLAYVRPHGERLLSTFAERSKMGRFHKSLEVMHDRLINNRSLFYTPRFERWRDVFGDRFSLRVFRRDLLYQGDVVQDFFRHLFGSEAFSITQGDDQASGQNSSLRVEDIAMMRMVHGHLRRADGYKPQLQEAFGWYMSDLLGAASYPGGGTTARLHKTLAQQVVETYAADAAALDAAFFDGSPMADALATVPDKAVAQPQSFQAKDHFRPPEMRRMAVWAQFMQRIMAADPAHFIWAARSPDQRADTPPVF